MFRSLARERERLIDQRYTSEAAKTFLTFIYPGAIPVVLSFLVLHHERIRDEVSSLLLVLSYIAVASGILIGWQLHRLRLLYATVLLFAADQVFLANLTVAPSSKSVFALGQDLVIVLLPLNFLVYGMMKERSALSLKGGLILGSLALQALLVSLGAYYIPEYLQPWFSRALIPVFIFPYSRLPQLAIFLFALAGVWLILRFLKSPTLLNSGSIWALLCVFWAVADTESRLPTTTFLSTAGFVLIIAVLKSSYRLAYHDELTGLPGRRACNEKLQELSGRYVIAMVDIDHFKDFNDRYGHEIGDQVLRMVAAKLSAGQKGGKTFRYGGEEFVVIFTNRTLAEVKNVLEKIRVSIAESGFVIRGRHRPKDKPDTTEELEDARLRNHDSIKVAITISIGLAERNDQNLFPEDVLAASDTAMYEAKQLGRNQSFSASTR